MIQIDKTDNLYKTLQNLGVDEQDIDSKYVSFAENGIITNKDFNNNLQAKLGMDFIGDINESLLEDVVDYYKDIKSNKPLSKTKANTLLKDYQTTKSNEVKTQIVNSYLKEVLLIACAYKLCHEDINLNDLVQVCNMGLMMAVDKYKCDSKISFETYLNYWILEAINKEFTIGEQKNG